MEAAESAQVAIPAQSATSAVTQAVQPATMAAPVTPATIASGLLAVVGLTPLAPGPAAPVEAPAMWAMLAVAAARRQTPANQAPTLDPMQTSQGLDGTVHGTFGGADPNVTIDQAAGTFTHNPDEGYVGTDQFTVTVSDIGDLGFRLKRDHTATATVASTVAPSSEAPMIVGAVILNGYPSGGLVFSEDGTRAYQISSVYDPATQSSTTVMMAIDAFDGTVVGHPATLNGAPSGGVVLSEDGTRAYQTTYVYNSGTSSYTTVVTAIHVSEGTVVGEPIALHGFPINGVGLNEGGTRAYQTTYVHDPNTGRSSTVVAVINPTDGTVVNDPLTLNGSPIGGLVFSQDGTRAYQTTTVNDPGTGWSSTVTVIDPTDGTVVGDPLTLNGFPSVGLVFSQDGTRAYQTTTMNDPGTGSSSTVVAVIDPTDGSLVGDPLILNGSPSGGLVFSEDGTRAYQITYVHYPGTAPSSTMVAVIDPTDGTVVADALTLNGFPTGGLVFSQDGTRAYQTTSVYDPGTSSYTTVVTAIDPTSGRISCETVTLNGSPTGGLVFSEDGTRAYQTTSVYDPGTSSYTTVVTAIDPTDRSLIGDPVTLNGYPSGGLVFSQDGTRAYQTTTINDPGTGSSSTVMAVIDPTDGSLIGDPLTLNGYASGGLVFSQDGTRAYQTTIVYDPATESNTTVVTAIDPTVGSLIGDPLTLNGYPSGGLVFSQDGTRAYQITYVYAPATQSYTTTAVTVIDTGVTPAPSPSCGSP